MDSLPSLESIYENSKACPDDMLTMICDFVSMFNYKIAFFLFIIYILLNSTVFYFQLINTISPGSYDTNEERLTERGLIVIGILLVSAYLVLDVLNKTDVI